MTETPRIWFAALLVVAFALTDIGRLQAATDSPPGNWIDTTKHGRSGAQWRSDMNSCWDKGNQQFSADDIKPGPPGNYYGNALQRNRLVMTFVFHDCMPKHGWRLAKAVTF
jgi:hypothetical protein